MNGTAGLLALAFLAAAALRAAAGEALPPPDEYARGHAGPVTRLSKPANTYASNCAACHGPSGRTVSAFPTLVDRIGYFARIPGGRAYLAQVPNVAMSHIDDQDLAEMLNWLLKTYSAAQLPSDFKDYTAAEIGELRQARIIPWQRRKEVIDDLIAAGQLPTPYALQWDP